ncbi:hypothetical protein LWI29_034944 [Acer saccharum]|uniref:Reticulon domain-containing protein n=1 Tax=Acer saccharum TaxID=4024 RepID=A0AA39SIW0_ACESA|nr:hypothetical protein LWI29_034944 [Acer saccharum]
MDSNPNSQTKSASRLARISSEDKPPHLSLDLVASSPKKTPSMSPPSLPLHELLLLSTSPMRKSRTRLADRFEMAGDEGLEPTGSRRKCKTRGSQTGLSGCASPRNNRRSRRKSEMETRDERDVGFVEEVAKLRKRRHSVRSKKEKLSLVPCVSSSSLSPKMDDDGGGHGNLDRFGHMVTDLIMWRDVAKSSLWFGFGCLSFFSSCFTRGVNFSIFAAISQLGLLFLGASFFSNSILQRNQEERRREFKLKEDDVLRLGRVILPATNLVISKTRELFSGEPLMTLKVVPFLLLGAEYGHLITMRRFFAIVENMKNWVLEAWGGCSHKKFVAASAVMAFWNLSTVKTRIFTAFISLVILRCCRKHLVTKPEEVEAVEQEQQQALVVAKLK